ncbi:MAG: HAMP domain-containing histidine kinase [Cyclobacteriaceae bacterium]|nr:HAMP domain-containing histidine kinase [Cyclobacteriaceae bacterium]
MKAVLIFSLLLIVSVAHSQTGKGSYYLKKSKDFLEQKKLKQAEQYADSLLLNALQSHRLDSAMMAYLWLSSVNEAREDYESQLHNFKMVLVYRDSIESIKKENDLEETRLLFASEKESHNKQLNFLRDEIKNLYISANETYINTVIIFVALLLLIGVATIYLLRKKNQAQRQVREANLELKVMHSFRERLAGVMTSTLKNSLTSFENLTQSMAAQIPRLSKEDSVQFLRNLNATAADLKVDISNVVEWTNHQADAKSFHPEVLECRALAQNAIDRFQTALTSKNISAELFMPEGQRVYADQKMMDIVLDNLISNAIHFTPPGGTITFFSGRKDGLVTMGLRDTGVGISPENLAGLFNENPSSNSKKQKDKNGFGLMLTRGLIERNGGQFYAESELDKGSNFYFSLPENKF